MAVRPFICVLTPGVLLICTGTAFSRLKAVYFRDQRRPDEEPNILLSLRRENELPTDDRFAKAVSGPCSGSAIENSPCRRVVDDFQTSPVEETEI